MLLASESTESEITRQGSAVAQKKTSIYQVTWRGIPERLQQRLGEHVEFLIRRQEGLSESDIDLLLEEAPGAVKQILSTEGYFNAEVKVYHLEPYRRYRMDVLLGDPVRVKEHHLQLQGRILKEDGPKRISRWRSEWTLPVGSVLTVEQWENAKVLALRSIQKKQFPKAKITEHRVEVDPDLNQAVLFLTLDSGPLARFSSIDIEGLKRYPEQIVRGLAQFKEGDVFQEELLADFQSALERGKYLSGVIVTQEIVPDAQNLWVKVKVKVTEAPRQKIDVGLAWDKEEGMGFRFEYTHYNVLARGWESNVLVDAKRLNPKLSMGLATPRNAAGYSYVGALTFERQKALPSWTIKDEISSTTASLFQVRLRQGIEARWGIEFLQERTRRDNHPLRSDSLATLNFYWKKEYFDRKTRPRSGYRLSTNLSTTVGDVLAKYSLNRALTRFSYWWSPIQSLGTFSFSTQWGEVWVRHPEQVPLSKLFLAGGAQSVRGYGVESITSSGGDRGTRLVTGSIEYKHPIADGWTVALFSDVGKVSRSGEASSRWHLGYGMGIRWYNSLVPLQLDIAKGRHDSRRFRWYLGMNMGF